MVRIPDVNCLAQVQSLVEKLRSRKLHSVAKEEEKKKKKTEEKKNVTCLFQIFLM